MMKDTLKKWIKTIKKLPVALIGCLLVIVTCAISFVTISKNPTVPMSSFVLNASFCGEYKIEDGDWQTIPENGHISATKGDVTLLGKFVVTLPDGEFLTDNPATLLEADDSAKIYFNFYCNHIAVQIRVGDNTVNLDPEHPQNGENSCGAMWVAYEFPESTDGVTEIVISLFFL